MNRYDTSNRPTFSTYLCGVYCVLVMIFISSCGDGTSNRATDNSVDRSDTGSTSFSVKWHQDTTRSLSTADKIERSAIENCSAVGVETITCEVYDENKNHIASGGPWSCSDKSGIIDRIPAGPNRTFAVFGWNAEVDGVIIYRGITPAGTNIVPGVKADTGTIDAEPFVPKLSQPANNQTVTTSGFSLTWEKQANAHSYRVLISEDENFKTTIVDETTDLTTYAPILSATTTYFWMIRAVDDQEIESGPSEIRRFTTDDTTSDGCMAPQINPIENQQIEQGKPLTFQILVSDPDGKNLTYQTSGLPDDATFDDSTQTFNWTPDTSQEGNHIITFTVCNDCSEKGSQCSDLKVNITVGNACQPPTLNPIGSRQLNEGESLTFTLSASDPDGGTLKYSYTDLPDGAHFDNDSNTFSWTPDSDSAGNYPITFTVCDDCPEEELCDEEEINITVGDACRPPAFIDPGDQQVTAGQPVSFFISAIDPDNSVLTYSAPDIPDGAHFDTDSHLFSWSTESVAPGNYKAVFRVCDNCPGESLCDEEEVNISVGDVCQPPTLHTIGNYRLSDGESVEFTVNATDVDSDTLIYTVDPLPEGAEFDSQTRIFRWTPDYNSMSGDHTVTFSVCDECPETPLCDREVVTFSVVGNIVNPVVGVWQQTIIFNCDVETTTNMLTLNEDNTFISTACSAGGGTWSQPSESTITLEFNCDNNPVTFSGEIYSENTEMSGRSGDNLQDCWGASKIPPE